MKANILFTTLSLALMMVTALIGTASAWEVDLVELNANQLSTCEYTYCSSVSDDCFELCASLCAACDEMPSKTREEKRVKGHCYLAIQRDMQTCQDNQSNW